MKAAEKEKLKCHNKPTPSPRAVKNNKRRSVKQVCRRIFKKQKMKDYKMIQMYHLTINLHCLNCATFIIIITITNENRYEHYRWSVSKNNANQNYVQ